MASPAAPCITTETGNRAMIRIFSMAGVAALLAGMAPHADPSSPSSPASSTLPAAASAPQEDFHWSGRLAQGEQITVNNIIGDIRAEPTDGDEVTVTGIHSGRNDVHVEVVRRREGVVICAVYEGQERDRGGRYDDDDDDDAGTSDACTHRNLRMNHDEPGRIRFIVRVPAGVKLVANTVSGDVETQRLRGPVVARSVSGDVHVASAGPVEAASVSGDVYAALGRMPSHDLQFRSVSGSVTLEVPAGIDADFRAQTLSGSIDSDFPLQRDRDRGGWVHVGEQAHATLGRGGPSLSVTTVSGDVILRRVR
jgi:hypothetical protein